MPLEKTFQAEVTLCTGVKVKALVQAKNIFHAHKSLEWVYGQGHVGLVREQQETSTSHEITLTATGERLL